MISSLQRLRLSERLTGDPITFRRRLEQLGPTFVKLGQYLALRPDLIPQEYCDELMLLFDRVAPFPWTEAEAIIAEDLGASPREIFAAIDSVPFAAGSLAQSHLARLHDGTEVAVKIQRPNIAQRVETDLKRARLLAVLMDLGGVSVIIDPRQVVAELAEWLRQEIDFRHELANLMLLHRLATRSPIEVIPRAFPSLSAGRVLTMEYLRGVPLSELLRSGARRAIEVDRDDEHVERLSETDGRNGSAPDMLPSSQTSRSQLAANLITATLRQIFRYQFFHADLHPGNLFAMPGDKIGYVDFGLCDSWDGTMRMRLLRYLAAVYSGEVEQMYAALAEILIPSDRTDMSAFRADFFAESRRWTSRMRTSGEGPSGSTERGSLSPIAQWMIGVMRIAHYHGLRVPPMVVSIYRALLVAETVASRLDASADLRSVGRAFFDRLQTDEALKALEPSNLQPVALNYLSLLRDGPGQLNQILAEIAEGTFAITVYTAEPPRLARMRNRRAVAIVLSVLSIGPTVLLTRPDLPEVEGIPLAWLLSALLLALYLSIFLVIRRLR